MSEYFDQQAINRTSVRERTASKRGPSLSRLTQAFTVVITSLIAEARAENPTAEIQKQIGLLNNDSYSIRQQATTDLQNILVEATSRQYPLPPEIAHLVTDARTGKAPAHYPLETEYRITHIQRMLDKIEAEMPSTLNEGEYTFETLIAEIGTKLGKKIEFEDASLPVNCPKEMLTVGATEYTLDALIQICEATGSFPKEEENCETITLKKQTSPRKRFFREKNCLLVISDRPINVQNLDCKMEHTAEMITDRTWGVPIGINSCVTQNDGSWRAKAILPPRNMFRWDRKDSFSHFSLLETSKDSQNHTASREERQHFQNRLNVGIIMAGRRTTETIPLDGKTQFDEGMHRVTATSEMNQEGNWCIVVEGDPINVPECNETNPADTYIEKLYFAIADTMKLVPLDEHEKPIPILGRDSACKDRLTITLICKNKPSSLSITAMRSIQETSIDIPIGEKIDAK